MVTAADMFKHVRDQLIEALMSFNSEAQDPVTLQETQFPPLTKDRLQEIKYDLPTQVEEPGQMTAAVGEIKKLNEQLSQLRQENIVLKVSLGRRAGHTLRHLTWVSWTITMTITMTHGDS